MIKNEKFISCYQGNGIISNRNDAQERSNRRKVWYVILQNCSHKVKYRKGTQLQNQNNF